MPQQDDGMEKRRQKREAQRKRRQAQVLRMRLTLMLVVVLFNVLARYISWRLEKKMEGTADD